MNQASADQAANLVISLYRGTAERPIVRFPAECWPTSFFDVQKIFDSLIENFGQPVQGWKLYFPFKAGQRNLVEIGSANVWTPVTNAHLVCRLLLGKKNHTRKC